MKPQPKPDYTLIGVKGSHVVRQKKGSAKSPPKGAMIGWGRQRGVDFVIRYWPSKKGWMALDIRNVFDMKPIQLRDRAVMRYAGEVQGKRVYPSEDAAVMHLMHVMNGRQEKLL